MESGWGVTTTAWLAPAAAPQPMGRGEPPRATRLETGASGLQGDGAERTADGRGRRTRLARGGGGRSRGQAAVVGLAAGMQQARRSCTHVGRAWRVRSVGWISD